MRNESAKAQANQASERVESETSAGGNSVEDARRAFENLFKNS